MHAIEVAPEAKTNGKKHQQTGQKIGQSCDADQILDSKTLFPSSRGGPLSADGVQHLLARHVVQARKGCASLGKKRVSPHVLRHAAAMELLQAGVDRAVIALWLGHESVETTQIYLDADLALKEQALAKTNPVKVALNRYQPDDELLAFLKQL